MSELPLEIIKKFWPDADPEEIQEDWARMHHQLRIEAEKRQKRKNIITWSDVKALTKHISTLSCELADYAARGYDKPTLFGDSNVFIALITLRKKIDELLEKHNVANRRTES